MTTDAQDKTDATAKASGPDSNSPSGFQEIVAVVLLSVTAILTAWSGFESSKWAARCRSRSARRPAQESRRPATTRKR